MIVPRAVIEMLPRMARPNLVARLYMLFVAEGTVEIAWLIPSSATTRILESGGALAVAVLWIMTIATAFGLVDVLFNDLCRISEWPRGAAGRFSRWIHGQRIHVCYAIGACYLVQAYAGVGSPIDGAFWLLVYYFKLAMLALVLAWSLMYLAAAEGARAQHPQ
jgi:hypothetical protein